MEAKDIEDYKLERDRAFDEYLRAGINEFEGQQLLFMHSYGAWENEEVD